MRAIETSTMINIKKVIQQHPLKAKSLLRNSASLDEDIEVFAHLAGMNALFIKQNIDRIRNWID